MHSHRKFCTRHALLAVLASLGLSFVATPPPALAQGGVEVGILTCESVPGTRINLLIHSTVSVNCEFSNTAGKERYRGETGIGLGVDLNLRRDEKIAFTVIGGAADLRPGSHALSGRYYGVKASGTVGVGAGAAVLVGGGAKNITLQPLALETSTGLGASGGLGYLYLEPYLSPEYGQ